MPGTAVLGGHPHEWYPLTEGPVVDLDALPAGQAVAAAVDRLLRMGRGERVELQSGADLDPVWREISELSPNGYQFTGLQNGPNRWRMQVTRRQLTRKAAKAFLAPAPRARTIRQARGKRSTRGTGGIYGNRDTDSADHVERPAGQRNRDGTDG